MIAVDTNVLVYSHRGESPFHARAVVALNELRVASVPWAIPWPCIHEFMAIVTNPRIFRSPTPIGTALQAVDAWLESVSLHLLSESHGYLGKLKELAMASLVAGSRIHDARIAALCLHHGVSELWTADRDFSAFPQLNTRNPLIPGAQG